MNDEQRVDFLERGDGFAETHEGKKWVCGDGVDCS